MLLGDFSFHFAFESQPCFKTIKWIDLTLQFAQNYNNLFSRENNKTKILNTSWTHQNYCLCNETNHKFEKIGSIMIKYVTFILTFIIFFFSLLRYKNIRSILSEAFWKKVLKGMWRWNDVCITSQRFIRQNYLKWHLWHFFQRTF